MQFAERGCRGTPHAPSSSCDVEEVRRCVEMRVILTHVALHKTPDGALAKTPKGRRLQTLLSRLIQRQVKAHSQYNCMMFHLAFWPGMSPVTANHSPPSVHA